jgi:putative ABC transport system substrate-binding protein
MMRRREVLPIIAAGVFVRPLATVAQIRGRRPVVGFLHSRSPEPYRRNINAFLQGLQSAGFDVSGNVTVDYRWARGDLKRLPALAADLIRQNVDVLVCAGGVPAAISAKSATKNTPIVFVVGSDPIKFGLVQSFSKPGGNTTGVSMLTEELEAKRIELLHSVLPNARRLAVLANPKNTNFPSQLAQASQAGRALGIDVVIVHAQNRSELPGAVASIIQQGIGGVTVASDPFFLTAQSELIALAGRHGLPFMYTFRGYAEAGGLMSYGTDLAAAYRQAGDYAGRILKGEEAGDMPVHQSTTVELVINIKKARKLAIDFPPTLLARADEVIE